MPDKPAAVFDAGIVLQAALRPRGPAGRAFALIEEELFTLYVSEEGLAEYRDVLSRPSIRRKNPHLTDALATALVERLCGRAVLIPDVPAQFQYPRDPDDEHVVNLAIAVGARYLVSRDKDLLDLWDESRPEGRAFRQRFPHLRILDPVAFLREIIERGSSPPMIPGPVA